MAAILPFLTRCLRAKLRISDDTFTGARADVAIARCFCILEYCTMICLYSELTTG